MGGVRVSSTGGEATVSYFMISIALSSPASTAKKAVVPQAYLRIKGFLMARTAAHFKSVISIVNMPQG